MVRIAKVVEIDYEDLAAGKDLSHLIEEAFGRQGLGILTVKNVPGYAEKRSELLPLGYKFAGLPDEIKAKYEHPASHYSFGWSHGKESFAGKLDTAKGSYYANPQYDVTTDDEELIKKHPAYCHPNIWPTPEDFPYDLPNKFKACGQTIVNVGLLIAEQCDRYVSKHCPTYTPGKLHNLIKNSKTCKARLLHYFPVEASGEEIDTDRPLTEEELSSWCGWHLDHGSLTGLASAMYFDANGNPVENRDKNAGLYIKDRNGEIVKVTIPATSIGFQIGESAQIHSGGWLQATPHAVMAAKVPGVSRSTLAVFMQPMWDEMMDLPEGVPEDAVKEITTWSRGIDFNELSARTFQRYYGGMM